MIRKGCKDGQCKVNIPDFSVKDEIKKKVGESSSASTIVGATKEDLEELGLEGQSGSTLHEEAKKKGGSLSMKDLMDLGGV